MILSFRVGRIFISRRERIKRAPWTVPQNTHRRMHAAGTRRARRKLKGPPLQRGLPGVCHTPSPPSSPPPPYLPLQKYQAQRGGGILCDNTHTHRTTHSSRRRGQIVRDTLEPSRKPRCARDKAGQKKKPVSHAEALGQLYKDSHSHKHTQAPPCCMQSCGMAVGEKKKKKSTLPLLEMRNIIQGPSFLSNTGGCLYSKPCLDKFDSIRRAEKKNQGKSKYIQLHFWCGGSPFQMTQSPLPFQSLRENTPEALHSSSSTLIMRVTSE